VHDLIVKAGEQLARLLGDEGKMAVIAGIDDFILGVEHDALDGGGANVKADSERIGHKARSFLVKNMVLIDNAYKYATYINMTL